MIYLAAVIAIAVTAVVGRWLYKVTAFSQRAAAHANALAKLSHIVRMFREGIEPTRLSRGSDARYLAYYIGYITAVARTIAEAEGISADDTILSLPQMEASRLLGVTDIAEGSLEEGAALLPSILAKPGGIAGEREGYADGRYAADPANPGPYFPKLREHFGVVLPSR